MLGQEILVGQSSRTNEAGIKVLSQIFSNLPVSTIQVSDALHLKSVCSLAAPSTIILGIGNEKAQTIVEVRIYLNLGRSSHKKTGRNCFSLDFGVPKLKTIENLFLQSRSLS